MSGEPANGALAPATSTRPSPSPQPPAFAATTFPLSGLSARSFAGPSPSPMSAAPVTTAAIVSQPLPAPAISPIPPRSAQTHAPATAQHSSELARSAGSDGRPPSATSPGVTTPRPAVSPQRSFPAPPAIGQITTSAAPRANPMSMSSLLSTGADSAPPASTSASMTRAAPAPQAAGHHHHHHHHHPAPYPQPSSAHTQEQAFYDRQRQPQRAPAEWSNATGPPQRQSSGETQPSRFDFHTFERKRQVSEGSTPNAAGQPGAGPAPADPRYAFDRPQYDFAGRLGQGHAHSQSLPQQPGQPAQQHRAPVQPSASNPYSSFTGQSRAESFFAGSHAGRPVESEAQRQLQHQHHHHHAAPPSTSQPPRKPDVPVTTAPSSLSSTNAWNKAFAPQPWPPTLQARASDEKQSTTHKRKRSEWAEGGGSAEQQQTATQAAAAAASATAKASTAAALPTPKRPPGPLFTTSDIERNGVRPKLMQSHVGQVEAALKDVEPRVIDRFVWDPLVDTAQLLDGAMLARHVGHQVQVVIDGRWLGDSVEVGDPAAFDPQPLAATVAQEHAQAALLAEEERKAREAGQGVTRAWTAWDLEALRRRKVWGTDVSPDDSDVLAMALHSGWVRYRTAGAAAGAKTPVALEVTLKIAPALVRYVGCLRGGVKSRSWGNGHDGVSLIVEKVVAIESMTVKTVMQSSRERKRRRVKQPLREIGAFGLQDQGIAITTQGSLSISYSPETAARLARALLQEPTASDSKLDEDVTMQVDDEDDEDIVFDESPALDPLSLKGYVLLLSSATQRHELSAASDCTYSVDEHAQIAATDLEFNEQHIVIRSADGSERARYEVARLSWRMPSSVSAV